MARGKKRFGSGSALAAGSLAFSDDTCVEDDHDSVAHNLTPVSADADAETLAAVAPVSLAPLVEQITLSAGADIAGLRARLECLLPWRSTDGSPLGMAVLEVGYLGDAVGGSAYAVVSADSLDAADELRHALEPMAGLTDEQWRSSWFETSGRLFAIRIYPRA